MRGMTKICTKCGVDKPFSDYYKMKRGRHGLNSWCKSCMSKAAQAWRKANRDHVKQVNDAWIASLTPEQHQQRRRESRLRTRYGLTQYEFDALGQVCAICGSSSSALVVDHDHSCCSGERSCGKCIRGVLCRRCNLAIGHLDDNINRLKSAIKYLEANIASGT